MNIWSYTQILELTVQRTNNPGSMGIVAAAELLRKQ